MLLRNIYQTTWCHIPEDSYLQSHCRENLKFLSEHFTSQFNIQIYEFYEDESVVTFPFITTNTRGLTKKRNYTRHVIFPSRIKKHNNLNTHIQNQLIMPPSALKGSETLSPTLQEEYELRESEHKALRRILTLTERERERVGSKMKSFITSTLHQIRLLG
jgi:hypothetical protein